jgi:hypothetical protein
MVLSWEDVKARYASAYNYGYMASPAPRFCTASATALESECLRYALAPPGEYRAMLLGYVTAGSLAASLLLSVTAGAVLTVSFTFGPLNAVATVWASMQFFVSLLSQVQLLQVLPWAHEPKLPAHVLSAGLRRMMFHAGMGIIIGCVVLLVALVAAVASKIEDAALLASMGGVVLVYIGQWCYDANVWRGGLFFYEQPAAKGFEQRFMTHRQELHGPVWTHHSHDATITI